MSRIPGKKEKKRKGKINRNGGLNLAKLTG
jgi:hypothetical protein